MANQQSIAARYWRRLVLLGALLLFSLPTLGCAGASLEDMARAKAVAAKSLVDVSVDGYTRYCEGVRRPACIEQNTRSKDEGNPWTRDDRIACLGKCSSESADAFAYVLRRVVATQIVVWHALALSQGDETLKDALAELHDALLMFEDVLGPIQQMLWQED